MYNLCLQGVKLLLFFQTTNNLVNFLTITIKIRVNKLLHSKKYITFAFKYLFNGKKIYHYHHIID